MQQINAGLNEQIENQLKVMTAHQPPIVSATFTQTGDIELREFSGNIIADTIAIDTVAKSTQTDFRMPSGNSKPGPSKKSKQDTSDSHLMATLRGMRVDLAIKEKSMQRLTKELEECKKTIRKLQKENEGMLSYVV